MAARARRSWGRHGRGCPHTGDLRVVALEARAPVRDGLEQRKTNADGQAEADKDETLASLAKATGRLSNGLLGSVLRQSRDKRGLSECRRTRCPVGVEKQPKTDKTSEAE